MLIDQRASACKFVLVGLASHAGPDGAGAFSSVAALVRYTRPSGADGAHLPGPAGGWGIIRSWDPDVVAARITRPIGAPTLPAGC
jgi:hypothetical protein